MIVCCCNNVSSESIKKLIQEGKTPDAIIAITDATTCCGVCKDCFNEVCLEEQTHNFSPKDIL